MRNYNVSIHCMWNIYIHSFIYYAFIKSIQGLAPIGYRTCHRIIQKHNTNININITSICYSGFSSDQKPSGKNWCSCLFYCCRRPRALGRISRETKNFTRQCKTK